MKKYVGKIETDSELGYYWYIVNRSAKHVAVCGGGFAKTKQKSKRAIKNWFRENKGKLLKNRVSRIRTK